MDRVSIDFLSDNTNRETRAGSNLVLIFEICGPRASLQTQLTRYIRCPGVSWSARDREGGINSRRGYPFQAVLQLLL